MKNIIFLTADLKAVIDASGLSLDSLLPDVKENHFSREDLYLIDYMTTKSRGERGVLEFYGFGFSDSTDALHFTNRLIVPKVKLDEQMASIDAKRVGIKAYCPNKDTIILWQLEHDEDNNSHLMFKANLKEILQAMARVLPVENVLSSTQFELAILRG
jgi:hypothetical protein